MPEYVTLYNTGGRQFGKNSAAWGYVKEHVALGEHVHVVSREQTICWNGPCPEQSVGKYKVDKGMKL